MDKFVRNLITEWRRLELPVAKGAVIVAVSGGADSLAMAAALLELRALGKLDLRLVAAHFNHKLRGDEADADEEFVRNFASRHRLELAVGVGDIDREGNLEENARIARYDFLLRTAESVGASVVATAHTLNDQAETFLLNLLRGSGPAGLGGMSAVRRFGSPEPRLPTSSSADAQSSLATPPEPFLPFGNLPILLARPLLTWAKRIDTENFCHISGVEFRYDSMNEDLGFRRVRVRKILLPAMEEFNPKIVETLANTANLMRQLTEDGRDGEERPAETLSIRDLKLMSKGQLYTVIRRWLEDRRGNTRGLELKHIEAIERLIRSRKSGKTAELPGGTCVVKRAGSLVFEDLKVEKSGLDI